MPRYNKAKVDSIEGLKFQGFSIKIEKGIKKIIDHKVVDVVTFSFLLCFNFKVKIPPMQ